jgi:hypothetical protein
MQLYNARMGRAAACPIASSLGVDPRHFTLIEAAAAAISDSAAMPGRGQVGGHSGLIHMSHRVRRITSLVEAAREAAVLLATVLVNGRVVTLAVLRMSSDLGQHVTTLIDGAAAVMPGLVVSDSVRRARADGEAIVAVTLDHAIDIRHADDAVGDEGDAIVAHDLRKGCLVASDLSIPTCVGMNYVFIYIYLCICMYLCECGFMLIECILCVFL